MDAKADRPGVTLVRIATTSGPLNPSIERVANTSVGAP
jgi:hypothetical protein